MPRLPTPGGDSGNWGEILNEYLGVSLSPNGQLKSNSITQDHLQTDSVGRDQLAADSVTTYNLADASVTDDKLADGSVTSTKLASGAITKASIGLDNVDNTSDANKPISTATQTALDSKIAVPSTAVTHNALVRFDGTSGKLVKSSALYATDAGWVGYGTATPSSPVEFVSSSDMTANSSKNFSARLYINATQGNDLRYGGALESRLQITTDSTNTLTENDSGYNSVSSQSIVTGNGTVNSFAGYLSRGIYYGGTVNKHYLYRAIMPQDQSSGTASIGTLYGYYAGGLTNSLSAKGFGFYQSGMNDFNYFAGKTGINTESPTHSLTLGSTASGITLYNTTDQTTNYERLRMYWSGNTSYLVNESSGTGGQRPLRIGAANSTYYQVDTLNQVKHTIAATSGVAGASILDITSNGLASATGVQYGLRIAPTLLQTSSAGYTALLVNPTESTIGSGTKLLADFQVNNQSKVRINTAGNQVFSAGGGLLLYNTADEVTNYERFKIAWESNALNIQLERGGTGVSRTLTIGAAGPYTSYSNTASTKIIHNVGGTGITNSPLISNMGTFSASSGIQLLLGVQPSITQTGSAGYTALVVNPIETTTGSGTKLLADFQSNGVSRVKIANSGQLTIADGTQAAGRVLTSDANGNATWLPSNAEPAGQAVNVNSPGASFDITTAMYPSLRTITLSTNLTFTLSATPPASSGGTITLVIKQPASGGPFTITWPASLEWAGDAPGPTMPTPANAELIVHLLWTGNVWRGTNAGSFFP